MALAKVHTGVMTRKGQSSRWTYREEVKTAARKRRRRQDKTTIQEGTR